MCFHVLSSVKFMYNFKLNHSLDHKQWSFIIFYYVLLKILDVLPYISNIKCNLENNAIIANWMFAMWV